MSSPALIAGLRVRRRVVYVSIYELIAIAVVTVGLSRYTGQDAPLWRDGRGLLGVPA
jgi:hypothetical protein